MHPIASEQSAFLHAIGLGSKGERDAYLDEVCRDAPALRAELDALLAAHDRLGGREPAATASFALRDTLPAPAHAAPEVGAVLAGRYKLLEPIGEGGMGTVWMAQQTEPVRRLVAVKLLRPGMDGRQVLARFEAERQALALMDHPNIAKIFDAGTTVGPSPTPAGADEPRRDEGRPFFAMELVKGVPVTHFCDERKLTTRERLELFVPVCQAVQHAHQKGVIHRDIKPSNVLVALYDGRPVPKVIDFGIAKAVSQPLTERTLHTAFGAVIGTLEYMSPEQAGFNQLDVDTRSDVYSLGVLLYELLTGSTPLDHRRVRLGTFSEVVRRIAEEEPPRPSARLGESGEALAPIAARRDAEAAGLTKELRGDLDSLVMKCLEKDREQRYETANALAADVQRYLNDEPISACPVTSRQRAWRWYRRNAAVVAGAFTVFTFLTPALMYVALFVITQLMTRGPERGELLSGLAFTAGVVAVYLGCAESGVAACRGKRRGLWVSLVAFVWFSSMSVWTLYCAIVVSRDFGDVSMYSLRSFDVHTPDGRRGFIRNSVIGFALMGISWSALGLSLQVRALCGRVAEASRSRPRLNR